MSRILVTGGAGYIGSVLVPHLLSCGHHVTVLDNFMHRQNSLAAVCRNERFAVIHGDCRRDWVVLEALKDGIDFIIPLAAIVGAPACNADVHAATSTNERAIEMLCDIVSPSHRIITATSNSGYGIGDDSECTENSPLRPVSLYGTSKVRAEKRIMERGNSISLRLATVYGASPKMRIDLMVNDFVHKACTDKALVLFESHFRRNFVHVFDVALAFQHCIANFDALKGEVYNVGDSRANLTKAQLCAKIKEHVRGFVYLDAPIGEDADKRDYIVSNAKFEAKGWFPTVTLDDGIEELKRLFTTLNARRYANA